VGTFSLSLLLIFLKIQYSIYSNAEWKLISVFVKRNSFFYIVNCNLLYCYMLTLYSWCWTVCGHTVADLLGSRCSSRTLHRTVYCAQHTEMFVVIHLLKSAWSWHHWWLKSCTSFAVIGMNLYRNYTISL